MSYSFHHNLPEIARNGGFKLCEQNEEEKSNHIDWRFLATVDIYKIIKESDFEKIDDCVPVLIKSSISDLFNAKALDPVIGKIYNLSQLALEYLLFCTRFLDKSVSSLRESLFECNRQTVELRSLLDDKDVEIFQLQEFVKRLQGREDDVIKFKRNFEVQTDFGNNFQHQEENQPRQKDSNLIKAIKLELEVKTLKEKLNLAEKELINVSKQKCKKCNLDMKKTFTSVGIQINTEEKEKDDKEAFESEKVMKFHESIQSFVNEIQQFREQKIIDEERHRKEIAQLKEDFDKTLKILQEKEQKLVESTPSPAPRKIIPVEKKYIESDENLWKVRFKELEKMYEYNQAQMAKSMKDMEKAYAEKMKQLESSMEQVKSEKNIEVVKPPGIKTRITVQPQKRASLEEKHQKKVYPLPEKVKESSTSRIPVKVESQATSKRTFSAQKNLLDAPVMTSNMEQAAAKLLEERLKELNFPKNSSSRQRYEVERLYSQLASRRENLKKKYKDLFINRKSIKTKVDQIYLEMQERLRDEHLARSNEPVSEKSDAEDEYCANTFAFSDIRTQQFHSKLEQMLQKRIKEDKSDEKPKKKVLFNLNPKDEIRVQNEDDSDFNITSFEEDLK